MQKRWSVTTDSDGHIWLVDYLGDWVASFDQDMDHAAEKANEVALLLNTGEEAYEAMRRGRSGVETR